MVFNSFDFVFFFSAFLPLYWWLGRRSLRAQNVALLLGSAFFYAYWDYRFLALIAFSTVLDFFVGRRLGSTDDAVARKRLLWISVGANLGLLAVFKYFNFFLDSTVDLLGAVGLQANRPTLQILLPVGISFYTFQTMSYTIDIYRRKLEPTRSFLQFAVFVSFFPQLVAGPIERARQLLPQVAQARTWDRDRVRGGVHLVVWGLFKKVFVADNLAVLVDPYFGPSPPVMSGLDLWVVMVAFAWQIYGDFSGYTDIARGLARLLGFELMLNFNLPYFAKSPSDFWRRWHISLSSWLQEYLYISLGGSRVGRAKTYRNLYLTMLLGGLWHGAAWNFVIWGAYHGSILMGWHYLEERWGKVRVWRPAPAVVATAVMFTLTLYGWLTFRATSGAQIVDYSVRMLTELAPTEHTVGLVLRLIEFSWFLALTQCVQFATKDLEIMRRFPPALKLLFYLYVCLGIVQTFGAQPQEFIYFQF